jgi:hypothetical protein
MKRPAMDGKQKMGKGRHLVIAIVMRPKPGRDGARGAKDARNSGRR